MNKLFEGKIALITGGSRGIGKAITEKLAMHGSDVIINYFRNQDAAESTANEAKKKGVNVEIIKAHIGNPREIDKMFHEIEARFGSLDILVNNAASGVARNVFELNSHGWDWTMNINTRGAFLCSQRAAKIMPNGGKIVNISSLGSQYVLPLYAAVGISKAALEALTRYLAIELAPKGINVNGIAASAVKTEALKVYSKGIMDKLFESMPVERMVEPNDIADLVSFLCSNESAMIRGQIIVIDGGRSLIPFGYPLYTSDK